MLIFIFSHSFYFHRNKNMCTHFHRKSSIFPVIKNSNFQIFPKHKVQFVTMDAGYKTPWIAKKTLDDGKVPVLPYTRYNGNQNRYKPWEYTYDPENDTYTCPRGGVLRHTTTDREGKRTYRSTPENCRNCPCKAKCGANEKGRIRIWQRNSFIAHIFLVFCAGYAKTPAFA